MSDPVVQNVSYTRVAASAPTGSYAWDVQFTAITAAGTRHPEHRAFGTLTAGLTAAQVKAAILQVAVDYDTAEKNPVTPPANALAGTYDAVDGSLITAPTDPRLPPGVTL